MLFLSIERLLSDLWRPLFLLDEVGAMASRQPSNVRSGARPSPARLPPAQETL